MGVNGIDPAFWRGRRVLLTGHTGFKGSWLSLWLVELGAVVSGLALEPDPVESPSKPFFTALGLADRLGARHLIGDIRHAADVQTAVDAAQPGGDYLAAQSLVRQSYVYPVDTWSTNVQGSLQLLESLRTLQQRCAVVLITTDKVYANREWEWGYREDDRLGGHDPYSASKAAMELMVASWRASFCGTRPIRRPTGHRYRSGRQCDRRRRLGCRSNRAGRDPCLRCRQADQRSQSSSNSPLAACARALAGYRLAQRLHVDPLCHSNAYNFGPAAAANRTVQELVEHLLLQRPGAAGWRDVSQPGTPHEAGLLHLVADRAQQQLGWRPRWDFATTVARTAGWYHRVHRGEDALAICLDDLRVYAAAADAR